MAEDMKQNDTIDQETVEETATDTKAGMESAEEVAEEKATEEKAAKTDRKSKKADKKADKLQEKVDELEDKVKRQLAEFENYRRRTETEKTAMFETGAKSVLEKILPVIDNFERGLAAIPEADKGNAFAEVKPIEAVGKEFDPNVHNAVMQVESDEYESGFVAQELLKGYTFRNTVIRHSMVAVVQ